MAENVYEGMFILDSNRYAKDAGTTSSAVEQIVEKNGGQLLASRLWSEQKLAYPIDGHRKGVYWLTYFRIDAERLTDVNRAARLSDNVLRSMVIKIDPRLVDAMVAHALGQTGEEPEAPSEDSATEGAAAPEGQTADADAASKSEPATTP